MLIVLGQIKTLQKPSVKTDEDPLHSDSAEEALATIKSIQAQFESLRDHFNFPSKLDFVDGDMIVSVEVTETDLSVPLEATLDGVAKFPIRKLAYTPTNAPVYNYIETIDSLLVALDAVECRGVDRVREKRRKVVRKIEKEARMFERRVRRVHDERTYDGTMCIQEEYLVTRRRATIPTRTASELEVQVILLNPWRT